MPWDYLLIDIVILVCYAAVASRMCGLLTQLGLYICIYVYLMLRNQIRVGMDDLHKHQIAAPRLPEVGGFPPLAVR